MREGGDRLAFHRIFRCFGDAALPHLSVMSLSCFTSTLLSEWNLRAGRNSILHLSGVQGSEDCANMQHSFSHNELPAQF